MNTAALPINYDGDRPILIDIDNMPIPVDSDGGIGDGAGPIPVDTDGTVTVGTDPIPVRFRWWYW